MYVTRFFSTLLSIQKNPSMPRSRSPYSSEYRAKIVALAQIDRTYEELAEGFKQPRQTIRNGSPNPSQTVASGRAH